MSGTRRIKVLALTGFAVMCLAVLGGMIWASLMALRLDRLEAGYEAEAAQEEQLRRALWRMDNWFLPILSVESGRSYAHYNAFYSPRHIYSMDGVDELPSMQYVLPSPLYETAPPDWVDLYFQVTPDGTWTSPQMSQFQASGYEQDFRPGGEPTIHDAPSESQLHRLRRYLQGLQTIVTPDDLHGSIVQAEAFEVNYERMHTAPSTPADAAERATKGLQMVKRARRQSMVELHNRWARTQSARRQMRLRQEEACEPIEVVNSVFNVVARSDAAPVGGESGSDLLVKVSVMYPMWYTTPDTIKDKLVFVRSVSVEGRTFYQGFMLRWEVLRKNLLSVIADIYPDAELEPVYTANRFEPRTMLTVLPARLVPNAKMPEANVTLLSPNHATLLVAWGVALIGLAVVGFGLWGLVSVSNRRAEFAYAVAHELRTPLTTFQLYTDMLSNGLVPADARQEYLDTLRKESQRLSDLVGGVLEYARVENRTVALKPSRIEVGELLERAREVFDACCLDRGVRFETDTTLEPEAAIHTDVDLLLCIARVLVTNACKHGGNGQAQRIVLRVDREGNRFHLDVIDNGPGIDPTDARHLYTPFRRGRATEGRVHGGIGLGLTLARRWSLLLGGRLELLTGHDPDLGGAHFRLTLPESPAV